eukprot:GFYU01011208.1.p1 GENE.GFYU01011208.1~~GFYU01011208.1.p1  ORF type:complete len:681 (-),score=119.13 GFYU01011208.1:223-2265(-)
MGITSIVTILSFAHQLVVHLLKDDQVDTSDLYHSLSICFMVFLTMKLYTHLVSKSNRFPQIRVNGAWMGRILEGDNHSFRRQLKTALVGEAHRFVATGDRLTAPIEEQRKMVREKVQRYIQSGLISVRHLSQDPMRYFASVEILSAIDPADAFVYDVHFTLFGGSILKLGTDKHHRKYLSKVDDMSIIGCFALNEFKHGVISGSHLDTTVEYDHEKKTMTINTPTSSAQKTWVTFAGTYATDCLLFANLIVKGVNHGIHPFVVPLRDEEGKLTQGITVNDMGHMICMNGTDCSRMNFDYVHVTPDALLDRYARITSEGEYESDIEDPSKRIHKFTQMLTQARVVAASAAVTMTKQSILSGIRYSVSRAHQGGPVLYDHLTQKAALLPIVAATYAQTFAVNHVKKEISGVKMTSADGKPYKYPLHLLVSALKSYLTRHAAEATALIHTKCGGMSILTANKLSLYRDVASVLTVGQGDSMILAQMVAKSLLRRSMGHNGILTLLMGNSQIYLLNCVLMCYDGAVSKADFQRYALRIREKILMVHMARDVYTYSLKGLIESKENSDLAVALTDAHADIYIFEHMSAVVQATSEINAKRVLEMICTLWALSRLEKHLGWYMTYTWMSKSAGKRIRKEINHLCKHIPADQAAHLVASYGFPDELMTAPIATLRWRKMFSNTEKQL